MRLTLAGQIALFANLALSILFAFLGFGIYSQRINWTDKKIGESDGKGDTEAGGRARNYRDLAVQSEHVEDRHAGRQ